MELFFIIIFGIVVYIIIYKSSKRDSPKSNRSQSISYKDFDISKRSSPHPNDTIIGNAQPTKPKGKVVSEEEIWSKVRNILSDISIVGTFYRTPEEISRAEGLRIGEELVLVKEPENNFDKNAIKVMTKDNYHIGYIPKNLCRMFNDILIGCTYRVFVSEIRMAPNAPYIYIKVEIIE
jgi:hypothetical protein